jgi:SAM-dependent methyltransferase
MTFGYDDVIVGLRSSYDARVDERDRVAVEVWKDAERVRFLELLRAEGRLTLLDVGAATGLHAAFFAAAGLHVTCVDLSPAMADRCRAKGFDAYAQDLLHLDLPRRFAAAFAMNSLLHIPPAELRVALERVRGALEPGALFYVGQYGGVEFEGVWERDHYEPKRYFSRLTDGRMRAVAAEVFAVEDFRAVDCGESPEFGHFQALTLRAPG